VATVWYDAESADGRRESTGATNTHRLADHNDEVASPWLPAVYAPLCA
jgi:hypothetical protein